jgi:hypothetical protein
MGQKTIVCKEEKMAKKGVFIITLVTLVTVGGFAQSEFKLSIGAGGYFTSDFGGGVEASVSGFGKIMDFKTPYAGGGGFIFLDATFVELSLGLFSAGGTWKVQEFITGESVNLNYSASGLDIGLLGKYPFVISEQLTLFPVLGITYRSILSAKLDSEKDDDPGELSALWFKFGGGLDYSFTNNIFLRVGASYGLRLKNEFEKDGADLFKTSGSLSGIRVNTETLLGHGLDIKLAIGYRF